MNCAQQSSIFFLLEFLMKKGKCYVDFKTYFYYSVCFMIYFTLN